MKSVADLICAELDKRRPELQKILEEMDAVPTPPGYQEWVTENAARRVAGLPLLTVEEWKAEKVRGLL